MEAQMRCKYAFNLPCIHICLATYYLFAFSQTAFKSSRVHFTRRDFLGSSLLIVVFLWLQIHLVIAFSSSFFQQLIIVKIED